MLASASMRIVLLPISARATPKFIENVVLPVPPFPAPTDITTALLAAFSGGALIGAGAGLSSTFAGTSPDCSPVSLGARDAMEASRAASAAVGFFGA